MDETRCHRPASGTLNTTEIIIRIAEDEGIVARDGPSTARTRRTNFLDLPTKKI